MTSCLRHGGRLLAALFALSVPVGGPAAAGDLALAPPAGFVEMRAYGLGLLPFDGKFTRFSGTMRYDAALPQKCQIMLEIDPSSLEMSNQAVRDRVIGPDFIDVARFPAMTFDGACAGQTVAGMLTLHGQTHPLALDLERRDGRLQATGRLRRDEWGMDNDPLSVGHTIRIRVELPLPGANS